MTTIPSRHNTKAVTRYAPFMEAVRDAYPEPILVDPAPLSPDTFACRFRDAVRGITEWNSCSFMLPVIAKWHANFKVVAEPGTGRLYIGHPENIKTILAPKFDKPIEVKHAEITEVESPSDETLHAILHLMELNILPHAVLTNCTEAKLKQHLEGITRPIEVMINGNTITLL